MSMPSAQDIARVKGMGFLHNRGTDTFSGRLLNKNGTLSADQLMLAAELARDYGNGRVTFTSRQQIEIPGIHLEDIDTVQAKAVEAGMTFGGTGARVRPITACKGTTCVYGNADTQQIAAELYDTFYTGWHGVTLPHKFKIGVGGCPNRCMKPPLNDLGIDAHRIPVDDLEKCRGCQKCVIAARCPMQALSVQDGKVHSDKSLCTECGVCIEKCPFGVTPAAEKSVFAVYAGGTWGKRTRMGTRLSRYYDREELETIVAKVILWFRENAFAKERLGAAIDRVGVEAFEKALEGDDLITRKEEILAMELKER